MIYSPKQSLSQEGRVLRLSFNSSLHPPYVPDSCVRASEASREGFCSIALSKKACHNKGGGWRVSDSDSKVVVVVVVVAAWGGGWCCCGVSRKSPKHQEFYTLTNLLTNLRLHFYLGVVAAGSSRLPPKFGLGGLEVPASVGCRINGFDIC